MNRYTDNSSPEPTSNAPSNNSTSSNISSCYKTPDTYQHYQSLYSSASSSSSSSSDSSANNTRSSSICNPSQHSITQFYPTPPSENEDSTSLISTITNALSSYGGGAIMTPLNANANSIVNHPSYYSSANVNESNALNTSSSDEAALVNRQLSYKEDGVVIENKADHLKELDLVFAAATAPSSSSSTVNEEKKSSRYKRRSRTCFTKHQLDMLEATFQRANYPDIRTVDDLSEMLKLSTERISIWFQNRRARFKKAKKQEVEAKENRRVEQTTATSTVGVTKHADYAQSSYIPSYAPAATSNYSGAQTTTTATTTSPTYQAYQSGSAASYFGNTAPNSSFYSNHFYQYPSFYQSTNVYAYSASTYGGYNFDDKK